MILCFNCQPNTAAVFLYNFQNTPILSSSDYICRFYRILREPGKFSFILHLNSLITIIQKNSTFFWKSLDIQTIKWYYNSTNMYDKFCYCIYGQGGINMRAIGCVRQVDKLGRLVLPSDIRRTLSITDGVDSVEFFVDDDSIIIKKYRPSCIFCNSPDDIIDYKNQAICENCFYELKNS